MSLYVVFYYIYLMHESNNYNYDDDNNSPSLHVRIYAW